MDSIADWPAAKEVTAAIIVAATMARPSSLSEASIIVDTMTTTVDDIKPALP